MLVDAQACDLDCWVNISRMNEYLLLRVTEHLLPQEGLLGITPSAEQAPLIPSRRGGGGGRGGEKGLSESTHTVTKTLDHPRTPDGGLCSLRRGLSLLQRVIWVNGSREELGSEAL